MSFVFEEACIVYTYVTLASSGGTTRLVSSIDVCETKLAGANSSGSGYPERTTVVVVGNPTETAVSSDRLTPYKHTARGGTPSRGVTTVGTHNLQCTAKHCSGGDAG